MFCICVGTNLREQHEDDISAFKAEGFYHVLVEEDELTGCRVGGKERRDERAKTPLLQDSRENTATLLCIALNKHLHTQHQVH